MVDSILIVDDDARLCALLVEFLGAHGYDASSVNDGAALTEALKNRAFSLLVLDVNMPGESGMSICRRMRDTGDFTPIIMLTARSEDVDRIQGLDFGADDYVPKPFNAQELLARIKAVLRRYAYTPPAKPVSTPPVHQFDVFCFDSRLPRLTRNGEVVRLSPTELAILKILIQHRAHPVSRTLMTLELRNRDVFPDERTIDVFVSRIRKHLGLRPDGMPYIQTVRSKGYMFLDHPDASSS
jgi:DNA-binding response OmpR family regulator